MTKSLTWSRSLNDSAEGEIKNPFARVHDSKKENQMLVISTDTGSHEWRDSSKKEVAIEPIVESVAGELVSDDYGSIDWANRTWDKAEKAQQEAEGYRQEIATWLLNFAEAEKISLKEAVKRKQEEGFKAAYKTVCKWAGTLPEYREQKEQKKLNPSKDAERMRKKREEKKEAVESNDQKTNMSPKSETCSPEKPQDDHKKVELVSEFKEVLAEHRSKVVNDGVKALDKILSGIQVKNIVDSYANSLVMAAAFTKNGRVLRVIGHFDEGDCSAGDSPFFSPVVFLEWDGENEMKNKFARAYVNKDWGLDAGILSILCNEKTRFQIEGFFDDEYSEGSPTCQAFCEEVCELIEKLEEDGD